MRKSPVPHPFLKWAGGKTQLTDAILERMPPAFNAYHEPFVGGGALFFRLYREQKIRRATISDINAELIDTYVAIRDCVSDVLRLLSECQNDRESYYAVREQDPWQLSLPERAARMIYLNKTAFNGLYRVNRRGKFNSPFGRYKNPKYCDPENLMAVSAALQSVDIRCESFETVLSRAAPGDWVYFDPPYVPLSRTASFTEYHANGFGLADQERLRDVCVELDKNGVYIMLSNSDTPVIHALYSSPRFKIDKVLANRAISGDGAKRGKVAELIITNYPRSAS